MLVSNGNLKHGDGIIGRGTPIPDIEAWHAGVLRVLIGAGKILDVSEEDAAKMRAEQLAADKRAVLMRARRKLDEAKRAQQHAYAELQRLRSELADAEDAVEFADTKLGEAEDEFVATTDGLDAGGVEPHETAREAKPESAPEPQPAPEPPRLGDAELRAKAVGTLGGFSRRALVRNVRAWYGVNLDDHVKHGSRKSEWQVAAYKIFEARYRLTEGSDEDPTKEALLAASLQAIGVSEPADS